MMQVPFQEKDSQIHGRGVFASEKILRGTIIWQFNPLIDHAISEQELSSLPRHMQDYVRHFAYYDEDVYVFCGDGGRYMNHAITPNTYGAESSDGYGVTIALRDIQPGEELTGDYREFDLDFDRKKTENPLVL